MSLPLGYSGGFNRVELDSKFNYPKDSVLDNSTTNKIGDDEMYAEKGVLRRVKDINKGDLIIVSELVEVVSICAKDREVFLKDGSCLGNVISLRMNEGSMLIGWVRSTPTVKIIDTREQYCELAGISEKLANMKDCGLITKETFDVRWSANAKQYKGVSLTVKYELVWE